MRAHYTLFQIDENYYTYYFDMAGFVKAMKDWLFFRTGDLVFKTADAPKENKIGTFAHYFLNSGNV